MKARTQFDIILLILIFDIILLILTNKILSYYLKQFQKSETVEVGLMNNKYN